MSQVIAFAPVRKAVTVDVGRKQAFESFTTGQWWPANQTLLPPGSKRTLVIEPRAGGRWYERNEQGQECEWGQVLAWEPFDRVLLKWCLNGNFQYDPGLHTEVEVRFTTTKEGSTQVDLEHRYIEAAGETAQALRDAVDAPSGWTESLGNFRAATRAVKG